MRRTLRPWRGDGDRSLVRWPRLAGEPLSWDIVSHDNVAVVAADGELDVGTAPGLAGDLGPLADAGGHLVLDLSGVRFCDCAGLSLFLRLQKHAAAAGGSLRLAGATAPVRRLITLAKLNDVLPVAASVAEVLATLASAGRLPPVSPAKPASAPGAASPATPASPASRTRTETEPRSPTASRPK